MLILLPKIFEPPRDEADIDPAEPPSAVNSGAKVVEHAIPAAGAAADALTDAPKEDTTELTPATVTVVFSFLFMLFPLFIKCKFNRINRVTTQLKNAASTI